MSLLAQRIANNQSKIDSVFECPRCNGKGWLPEFRHIKNGDCFLCQGAKTIKSTNKANFKGRKPKVVYIKANTEYNVAESLSVYFDGKYGYVEEFARYIKDENRQELRDLWKWFKANDAIMMIATVNKTDTEYFYSTRFDYQTV